MTSYFPYSLADETVFVSTMPAGHRQRRLARLVVTIAAVLFLIGLPFSWIQLPYIWAFIPIYESWLVLLDLITAVLLFGQYAILRTRALLVLGSGYLFTATITVMARDQLSGAVHASWSAWWRRDHGLALFFLEIRLCLFPARLCAAEG
jgi:Sec-independent protein secretion pathway component TatC